MKPVFKVMFLLIMISGEPFSSDLLAQKLRDDSILIKRQPVISGYWKVETKGDTILLHIIADLSSGPWHAIGTLSAKEFISLWLKKELTVAKDAGTMFFWTKAGIVRNAGTFIFTPDTSFEEYLKQSGISGIPKEWMLQMFICNINKDYFSLLKKNRMAHISKDQLRQLAFSYVSPDYITRMISYSGLKKLHADDLILLKNFKIDTAFILGLKRFGIGVRSGSKLILLRVYKITPDLLLRYRQLGLDVSLTDLLELGPMNITPDYIEKMREKGYTSLNLKDYGKLMCNNR